MANGDPFFHVTRAIDELRIDLRETRTEVGHLRTDLASTRETVARMQGEQVATEKVEVRVVEHRRAWRGWATDAAATGAIIISSGAAVVALLH